MWNIDRFYEKNQQKSIILYNVVDFQNRPNSFRRQFDCISRHQEGLQDILFHDIRHVTLNKILELA